MQNDPLERATADLGLGFPPTDQDWGIVNSDPDRVDEFVEYFERSSIDWPDPAIAGFIELILDSANQARFRDPSFDLAAVDRFLKLVDGRAGWALEYWTEPSPYHEDWPITHWLRRR